MSGSQDKNPFADPNYGKDLNSNGSSNPFSDPDYGKEKNKGFLGHTQDAGASLMKGLAAVPETIIGIADIPTGGRVGKFIEQDVGLDLKGAKEYWGDKHTD